MTTDGTDHGYPPFGRGSERQRGQPRRAGPRGRGAAPPRRSRLPHRRLRVSSQARSRRRGSEVSRAAKAAAADARGRRDEICVREGAPASLPACGRTSTSAPSAAGVVPGRLRQPRRGRGPGERRHRRDEPFLGGDVGDDIGAAERLGSRPADRGHAREQAVRAPAQLAGAVGARPRPSHRRTRRRARRRLARSRSADTRPARSRDRAGPPPVHRRPPRQAW